MKKRITNSLFLFKRSFLTTIMKIFILLFSTIVFSFTTTNGFSQNDKLKIQEDQIVSVDEVFKMIKNQTDYTFIYRSNLFENYPKIPLKKGVIRLNKLLEQTLSQGDFICDFSNSQTILIKERTVELKANISIINKIQLTIVSGYISDENGIPLPGVNVTIKGTKKGVSTDFDGKFKINVGNNTEKTVLVFSFIGYETQEIVVGSKTTIDLKMIPDVSGLDEVVVIGYGTAKARDLTGVVSRVSEKEVEESSFVSDVTSLIQGRAAGVSVMIQSASPSSANDIIIRGASSLGGNNQPLWVVDGVPQYFDEEAENTGDVDHILQSLNLTDVQSIDILKDASATAVYGSRAANGVVLVTTKTGRKGMKPVLEFSSRIGTQVMDVNGYDFMNGAEYKTWSDAAARQYALVNEGVSGTASRRFLNEAAFEALRNSEYDADTFETNEDAYFDIDEIIWLDELTQNPIITEHNLSLQGGSERTTYFASINYKDQEGIMISGGSERYTGRLNFDTQVNDRVKFGVNLNGSTRKVDNKDSQLVAIARARTDIPAYNEDGTYYNYDSSNIQNPLLGFENTNNSKGITLRTTAFLELDLTKDLWFKTSFTNSYSDSENLRYDSEGTLGAIVGSERTWSNTKSSSNVWDNTLTYVKSFNDKHDFNVLLGYSAESYTRSRYAMKGEGFPDDEFLNNFGSQVDIDYISEDASENALLSQFGRLRYQFDKRYILEGAIRRDGSSRFGSGRRWGIFPSGSAAWIVSGEKFMKSKNIKKYIPFLKLRTSLGLTGSQNLGNYDWITEVGATVYDGATATLPVSLGNALLQWENTQMFDLGIDFGLFKNRFNGSVGLYQKKSDELIFDTPLPLSSGQNDISANVASVTNNGFEIDFKYNIIRSKKGHRLTFNFNWATNKSIVTRINSIEEELTYHFQDIIKVEPGGEIGQWFGYETAGRFYQNYEDAITFRTRGENGDPEWYFHDEEGAGDVIYIDQNNDGEINTDDKVYLGKSAVPKGFGGFGLNYSYKGFSVNANFTYEYGHHRFWFQPWYEVDGASYYNQSNAIAGQSAILLDPSEASFPRFSHFSIAENDYFADYLLHDASYLRLNALNFGYQVPKKFLKNTGVSGVDFSLQGTNLLTITKYPGMDPQGGSRGSAVGLGRSVDYGYFPSAQTYSLGVKIKF